MRQAKPKSVGRPKAGKRSNPDYGQRSLWLPDKLYAEVAKALITPGKRYEFSALVEDLLRRWLDAGAKLPKH